MVEMIGRISKGTKMDQIYIPKNRAGFFAGEYVKIMPLENLKFNKEKIMRFKPYFYNIKNLEPVKTRIIEEVFNLVDKEINPENIIVTGSFLEKGFNFNDLDVLVVSEEKIDIKSIKNQIEEATGIKLHLILIDKKSLLAGISTDPLYNLMLSRCVCKNRIIFKAKRRINYKLLDLNLLKSKSLIDNFCILDGREKYYLVFNMVSVLLFISGKKLSREIVERKIEELFKIKINELKGNMLGREFLKKYKGIYNKTFNILMENIKNEAFLERNQRGTSSSSIQQSQILQERKPKNEQK